MKDCTECKREFPDYLIHPMITTEGRFIVCPICALDMRNKIHGLNDTEFQGPIANLMLAETREYLKQNE